MRFSFFVYSVKRHSLCGKRHAQNNMETTPCVHAPHAHVNEKEEEEEIDGVAAIDPETGFTKLMHICEREQNPSKALAYIRAHREACLPGHQALYQGNSPVLQGRGPTALTIALHMHDLRPCHGWDEVAAELLSLGFEASNVCASNYNNQNAFMLACQCGLEELALEMLTMDTQDSICLDQLSEGGRSARTYASRQGLVRVLACMDEEHKRRNPTQHRM